MSGNKQIKIPFKPKARLILQLGERLIANEKIAISELIKNSYDACARNVIVEMNDIDSLNDGKIIIEDDGIGMDLNILQNVWMEPGTDFKDKIIKKEISNENCPKRLPIGEKGIGRFGAHKLGNRIKIISKAKKSKEVELIINWNDFDSEKYLEDEKIIIIEKPVGNNNTFSKNSSGTRIEISSLRKSWTKKDYREFYRNAMSLTSPFSSEDDFFVVVKSNLNWEQGLFDIDDIFNNALWSFYSVLNNGEIKEFRYEFNPYKGMDKIKNRVVTEEDIYISKDNAIKRRNGKDYEIIDSNGIGKIIIEGYIYDFHQTTLELSQISDRKGIRDYLRENGGVRVYRDGMRVFDYGEYGNDWLTLDQSRINAPVTKIGNRQILAAISISRNMSKKLKEKTNREGFIENSEFYNFRDSIAFVLEKVNFLRNEDKAKIRDIYIKEIDKEETVLSILENVSKIIKNKKVVPLEKDRDRIVIHIEKLEENYVEMKETLLKSAGVGLQYSLIAHEIEKMVGELKEQVKGGNLKTIDELVKRLDLTIESIINLYINNKKRKTSINEILDKSINLFSLRSKVHKIELVKEYRSKNFEVICSLNYTISAIMNIIDNSIYWLKYHEMRLKKENIERKILITVKEFEDTIGIIIADTGYGFIISPESAVLPFRTTKKEGEGIGLGLYYVYEIMKMHEGRLEIITSKNRIDELNLPEEFKGAVTILHFNKEG